MQWKKQGQHLRLSPPFLLSRPGHTEPREESQKLSLAAPHLLVMADSSTSVIARVSISVPREDKNQTD